jgi:hypothetical protein
LIVMSWIVDRVHSSVLADKDILSRYIREKKAAAVFAELNRITSHASSKLGIQIILNFPNKKKLLEMESLGTRDMSLVVDNSLKWFAQYPEERIRDELRKYFPNAKMRRAHPAQEGFSAEIDSGTLTVLPGAVHLWCEIDGRVRAFLDWLFPEVYGVAESSG